MPPLVHLPLPPLDLVNVDRGLARPDSLQHLQVLFVELFVLHVSLIILNVVDRETRPLKVLSTSNGVIRRTVEDFGQFARILDARLQLVRPTAADDRLDFLEQQSIVTFYRRVSLGLQVQRPGVWLDSQVLVL